MRFREEQLENYEGPPLGYSSSDYHHVSRPFFRPKKRIASSHGENNGSRHSKFSIATNASGLKGSSTRGPMSARTIASYDPYRSSQTAITEPKVEYANVTIHRHMPGDSNVMMDPKSSPPFMQSSGNRTSLTVPSPKDGPWSSSRRSSLASFQSRSSMASFRQRSRPGRSYKRNVSFRHLQNQAVSNRVDIPRTHSQYFLSDDKRKLPPRQSERTNRLSTDRFSSPSLPSPQTCVRGVTNQMQTGESQGGANARKSYQYWKEEARKVSQELEQICEEAFNSSSLSSSRTTDTVSRYPESPVTSVSTPGNLNRYYANSKQEQTFESSSSYATKELAETRRRLIEHSKQASADGLPSYLSEVITHLDRLIGDGPTAITSESVTLSKESTQSGAGKLPPISEERHSVKDFFSSEGDASYLFSKPAPTKLGDWEEKKTIRAVPDSTTDLGSIKPLTIRKKRTTLELPISANETTNFHQSQRHLSDSVARNRPSGRRSTTEQFFSGLEPIEENPRSPKKSEGRNSGETRKWSWFKHKSQGCDDVGPPTPPKDGLSSGKSSMTTITHQVCQSTEWLPPLAEGDSSKLPKKSGTAEKGKKLLKLFSRRKHEKPVHEIGRGSKCAVKGEVK